VKFLRTRVLRNPDDRQISRGTHVNWWRDQELRRVAVEQRFTDLWLRVVKGEDHTDSRLAKQRRDRGRQFREIYTVDFPREVSTFRGPGNERGSLSTLMPKIVKGESPIKL
jgi:hypothetical protein